MAQAISSRPVEIDIRAPEPAYLQLARWLREGIDRGEWAPDELAPSITWLAEHSGLAIGTVRKAIRLLVDEGLLYTVPGRGTYVR